MCVGMIGCLNVCVCGYVCVMYACVCVACVVDVCVCMREYVWMYVHVWSSLHAVMYVCVYVGAPACVYMCVLVVYMGGYGAPPVCVCMPAYNACARLCVFVCVRL